MCAKWLVPLTLPPILVIVAFIAIYGSEGPRSVEGFILPPPPPIAVLLIVDTPTYPGVNGDGKCSLDEAIWAADNNGVGDPTAGSCSANASHSLAVINFSLGSGTPTINMTSFTQPITAKISINGNTGGATRVVLHGPGPNAGTGLDVSGSGAAGTSIRDLVINNFSNGIYLDTDTTKLTIAGNYIGTNAAGTAAVPNATGINGYYHHSQVQIGGLNALTPGGPCTGDCNLISGNTGDGIFLYEASGDLVEGNFIGTNAAGTAALGNGGDGISDWEFTSVTIGGTASGSGNLISGNKNGIEVWASQPVIKGNFIGSDVSGTGAIPNTSNGIYVHDDMGGIQSPEPFTIGGTEAGAGNLMSGNAGPGILLKQADQITLYGNSIGTRLDGTTPLSNAGAGVLLALSTRSNVIGGVQAGQGNVIAFNGTAGVEIGQYDYYNQTRGNSIHDNAGKGISLYDNTTNDAITPPVITGVNPVAGTACANCAVDIYSDAADEGKIFEGSATADGTGNWSFGNPVTGPNITTTNTNSQLDTSEFSTPFTLPATPTPTPSPTSTPTPTPAPTPTPTATQTPTPTSTPTPTATPTRHSSPTVPPSGSAQLRGDSDCNGHVDIHDVLATLSALVGVPPGATCAALADVDCDNDLAVDDAQRILDFVAGAPLAQPTNCPGVGTLT